MNDFDLEYEEEPEIEPVPLVPITSKPLPLGPFRGKQKQTKTDRATAEQYRKWIQRLLYRMALPMSHYQLNDLPMGNLRIISSMFKDDDGAEMRGATKAELIRFIAGRQQDPSQYLPIEKIRGVDFPDWPDQKYREVFESKLDIWRRPKD